MGNTPQATDAARLLASANEAAGDKDVPVEDVLALFRKALQLDPTMVDGWADLGASYGYLGRYDEALAALDRGLTVDPRHRRCLTFRGDALKRKGDYPAAVEAYHRLVACYPDDASAWVKYGTGLDLAGRLDDALAAMNRALALRPKFLDAVTGKANVEAHMGHMPAGGIPLAIRPGELMRAIAEAQVAEVIRDAAAAERTAAASGSSSPSEPTTPDACYARAVALAKTGDDATALPHLQKALALAPRHLGALEAVVATLCRLGRAQEAVGWAEKWTAHPLLKERDRARAFCAKGVCLRLAKDFVKSLAAIDQALVLDPGNVGFAKERAQTVAAARQVHGSRLGK